jgi:hypothetical protein
MNMDFIEKSKIRIESWIHHNEHHKEEYDIFADQLEEAGKLETARYIRKMASITAESSECLRLALKELENS